MNTSRSKTWSALVLAFALAGCAEETNANAPAEAAQALEARGGDRADAAHPPHGPRGPDHLLRAALRELTLTEAQKATIQGALDDLAANRASRGPKDDAAFATLAAAVRAGRIDTAAVLASARGFEPPAEARAALARALMTLHRALTPEQRQLLVDTMERRKADHVARGEHGPGPGHRARGPLGPMLDGLDVTDAQREAIAAALEARKPSADDREAMQAHFEKHHADLHARLESFAGDAFDANAFTTPPSDVEGFGPKRFLQRMAGDLAVVVPLLEPAQREKLADKLANGPPMMGPPRGVGR